MMPTAQWAPRMVVPMAVPQTTNFPMVGGWTTAADASYAPSYTYGAPAAPVISQQGGTLRVPLMGQQMGYNGGCYAIPMSMQMSAQPVYQVPMQFNPFQNGMVMTSGNPIQAVPAANVHQQMVIMPQMEGALNGTSNLDALTMTAGWNPVLYPEIRRASMTDGNSRGSSTIVKPGMMSLTHHLEALKDRAMGSPRGVPGFTAMMAAPSIAAPKHYHQSGENSIKTKSRGDHKQNGDRRVAPTHDAKRTRQNDDASSSVETSSASSSHDSDDEGKEENSSRASSTSPSQQKSSRSKEKDQRSTEYGRRSFGYGRSGENQLKIKFLSLGTFPSGCYPQRFGRCRNVIPDGLRGRHEVYNQPWEFEVIYNVPTFEEALRVNNIQNNLIRAVPLTYRLTNKETLICISKTETLDQALNRQNFGAPIITSDVVKEAFDIRADSLQITSDLTAEARSRGTFMERRSVMKERTMIRRLRERKGKDGYLLFGLTHEEVQDFWSEARSKFVDAPEMPWKRAAKVSTTNNQHGDQSGETTSNQTEITTGDGKAGN